MIRIEQNVIDTIEKVKNYIKSGVLKTENFPMDSICILIENTLGDSFWDCVGSRANEAFHGMPNVYKKSFENCMEKGDIEGCCNLLDIFKNSYKALYSVMSEDERIFRQKPYRKMIQELGNAYAQTQYRLHKERMGKLPKKDIKLMEGRGVVYTCLLEEGETLYQPNDVESRMDYICFTTIEEKWGTTEGVWKFYKIDNTDNWEKSKIETEYCILAHEILKDYDYSVWINHSIMIAGEIEHFCKVYAEGNSFLGFSQCNEDCLYSDISYTQMATDDLNIEMRKRIHRYKKEGYPEHNGLIDCCIMIRNHHDKQLQKVMNEWWEESQDFSVIEKNCFNYVAWKNDFPFSLCDLFSYSNPYFINMDVELDTKEEY